MRVAGLARCCSGGTSTGSVAIGTILIGAILACLFLFTTTLPSSAQTQAAGGQSAGQQSVIVRGNRRIEAATILSYMQLEPGQTIDAETLNLGVRRLFDTGLFEDVKVIPEGGRLIIQVKENPSINEIAFEGNDALKDEDLDQIIALRPRLPFTVSAAEADAQAIIDVYRRTGRYGAEVKPVIIERSDNRVDLVFEIDEGDLTGVNSIDFVGNEVFSDRRLRSKIETSESGIFSFIISTDVYDPDKLELDKELLRQFYLSEGYADFTVLSAVAELAPDRSGFFITFTVSEGEQYTFGTFDVELSAKGLNREEFLAHLPDDLEGETYDATRVEEIANDLTDLAGQSGFAFVRVRPRADKDVENRIINITFELVEGSRIFVERIDIIGNNQTLDRVIRREIDIVEGDPFDARKIREARNNIRALGFFSDVKVDTVEGSTDDRAVLTVKVTEQSTGSFNLGLGFSTDSGPIGSVSITERNFLGRGQALTVKVTASGDTQLYDFNFVEPKFLDRDLQVGFRTFFLDDDRSSESSFKQKRLGFTPSAGFPLDPDTDLRLRYNFLHDDITPDSTASLVIKEDAGINITSSVGYDLTYDQRNDPLEPTGGYLATLRQDFAGLGGDSRYVKTTASVKGWQGFFKDQVIASVELRAGGLVTFGNDSRVTERFFLGGDSFRGFADSGIGPRDFRTDDSVGGNYFGIARFEVSFPLGLPEALGIFGGAFVDAGSLFGLDKTTFANTATGAVTNIDDSAKMRVSAGGIIFVDTPFGPLELSLGYPLVDVQGDDNELFRLSVGTRF